MVRNNRKAIKQCRQAGGKNKKKMYKIPRRTSTSIERNESIEGEPIEMQIQRMINNGEVLGEEKEMIYTKPSEGVIYGTDIRGDKQEKAIEMTEKVAADVMRSTEPVSLICGVTFITSPTGTWLAVVVNVVTVVVWF